MGRVFPGCTVLAGGGQTLPEGVEEEEAKAVKLYIPMLKHYLNAAATAAEDRVRLQVEVLIALQDFYVVSDNPICTSPPPLTLGTRGGRSARMLTRPSRTLLATPACPLCSPAGTVVQPVV